MHVFLDDSTSFRRPGFAVFAGFMSTDDRFNALSLEWSTLLAKHDLPHLHTSDFLSAQGDHKDTQLSYEERKAALAEFIEAIRNTMQCCIIVAVEKADYYQFSAKERGELDPAGFCLQRIAHICHNLVPLFPDPTPLAFVFDDSMADSPKIYSAWAKMKRRHKIPRGLVASISFAEDHIVYPLQAADLLACGIVRENQKPSGGWDADSPFFPLFREAPQSPPGLTVVNESWNAETFEASGVFQSEPAQPPS